MLGVQHVCVYHCNIVLVYRLVLQTVEWRHSTVVVTACITAGHTTAHRLGWPVMRHAGPFSGERVLGQPNALAALKHAGPFSREHLLGQPNVLAASNMSVQTTANRWSVGWVH